MPLRCIGSKGYSIEAGKLDEGKWQGLRGKRWGGKDLTLPCCGAVAIPRESRTGKRYFAHGPGKACGWKHDTEMDRYLKELCLKQARRKGWSARTEVVGADPQGKEWYADVLAVKGNRTVAIAVEARRIREREIRERTETHQRAGMDTLWIVRQRLIPDVAEVAIMIIGSGAQGAICLRLPKTGDGPRQAPDPSRDEGWSVSGDAQEILGSYFAGQCRHSAQEGRKVRMGIETGTRKCWKCEEQARIVYAVMLEAGGRWKRIGVTQATVSASLIRAVNEELGRIQGLHTLETRKTRDGRQEMTNVCAKCGAGIWIRREWRGTVMNREVGMWRQVEADSGLNRLVGRSVEGWEMGKKEQRNQGGRRRDTRAGGSTG